MVKLRPLVVITPSVLLPLLLQVLQLCFVHHLLHQVLFPPHTIAEILWHVRDEVRNEGLNPKHQVLKYNDEGQPGSQDVPELKGELVGHRAPGRCSVVSVPAVSRLVAVQLAHVKHRQAAVHVASQTLILMVVSLVYTWTIFEGVNKAGDVV